MQLLTAGYITRRCKTDFKPQEIYVEVGERNLKVSNNGDTAINVILTDSTREKLIKALKGEI